MKTSRPDGKSRFVSRRLNGVGANHNLAAATGAAVRPTTNKRKILGLGEKRLDRRRVAGSRFLALVLTAFIQGRRFWAYLTA